MSSDESSMISLEEVNQALEEIENKYSPIKKINVKNDIEEELLILSKELDTVGLPVINLSKPYDLILKDVIASSRSLVHLHRKTLTKITDADIDKQSKNRRIAELYKVVDEYKSKLNRNENKGSSLENKLITLQNEKADLIKREIALKDEMEKVKRFHTTKQNETMRQYKKIVKEYQHLRKIYEKDAGLSKDEVLMNFLGKYRQNEEIYKSSIQKLQESNQSLMEEIVHLKESKRQTPPTKSKF